MALASTLTDIANLALGSIGEVNIQNIDENSTISRNVLGQLHESIRQVQIEIFWEELVVSFSPTALTEPYPTNPALFQYNLPTNFLEIVSISSNADWFLSGGKLVTRAVNPLVTYKRYSEEPTEWSAYLVELIYRKLAANIAMPVTQNTQITQMATQVYEASRLQNVARSSNRSRSRRRRESTFGNLQSRQRNYGRRRYLF